MMSALPQGADVFPNPVEVRFGPRAEVSRGRGKASKSMKLLLGQDLETGDDTGAAVT